MASSHTVIADVLSFLAWGWPDAPLFLPAVVHAVPPLAALLLLGRI